MKRRKNQRNNRRNRNRKAPKFPVRVIVHEGEGEEFDYEATLSPLRFDPAAVEQLESRASLKPADQPKMKFTRPTAFKSLGTPIKEIQSEKSN